ncbi:MAG: hypothetical protein R2854_00035 [Caldilineaceae bacterium]
MDKLISPLAYVPGGVGLVGLPADPGPGAGALRRQRCEHHRRPIYNYVVAALALILLWIGSIEILQALIDTGFSRNVVECATRLGAAAGHRA